MLTGEYGASRSDRPALQCRQCRPRDQQCGPSRVRVRPRRDVARGIRPVQSAMDVGGPRPSGRRRPLGTFIDWRSVELVISCGRELGLALINVVVWVKTNGGQGSLWRSQHELLPVFKKGGAPHINNVELGRHGRWRSNVWEYAGASSLGSDSRDGLALHPTVKPRLLARRRPPRYHQPRRYRHRLLRRFGLDACRGGGHRPALPRDRVRRSLL